VIIKSDPFCYAACLQRTFYSVPPPPSSGGMSSPKEMSLLPLIQHFLSGVQPVYENTLLVLYHIGTAYVKVYQIGQTILFLLLLGGSRTLREGDDVFLQVGLLE